MTTWFVAAGLSGLGVIGFVLWREISEEFARIIVDRQAEIEFYKMTDDELAAVILSDLRREIILS